VSAHSAEVAIVNAFAMRHGKDFVHRGRIGKIAEDPGEGLDEVVSQVASRVSNSCLVSGLVGVAARDERREGIGAQRFGGPEDERRPKLLVKHISATEA
jgi:hypothetical protein